MPVWLLILLMTVAAYRLTRLVIRDTFPPVLWLRDHLAGGWRDLTEPEADTFWGGTELRQRLVASKLYEEGDADNGPTRYVVRWKHSPYWLAELLTCPWCASAYVSGAVTLGVDLTVGIPAPYLVGVAVWGGAAFLASKEWA
jgi:hypothetical protein